MVALGEDEAALLARLLKLAADRFSNFGCNDFEAVGKEFEAAWRVLYAHDEEAPSRGDTLQDWLLMLAFARKIRGEPPLR